MRAQKVIRVKWNDISSYRGWRDITETAKSEPLFCISVGMQVKTKKGTIGLVQSIAENDDIGETLILPRSVVKSIEVLGKFKGERCH